VHERMRFIEAYLTGFYTIELATRSGGSGSASASSGSTRANCYLCSRSVLLPMFPVAQRR
jgi:hypothetical protein